MAQHAQNAQSPKHSKPSPDSSDPTSELSGLQPQQWEALDREARTTLLQGINQKYKPYVDGFYETANLCVTRHDKFIKLHKRWRYIAIVGTGFLACLNFAAAKRSYADAVSGMLPIAASLFALVLAVLANLESFSNSAEQAQTYRESRELYLDSAHEYDRAWNVFVVMLGDSAQAYLNATELYRRVIVADKELRRSFKDLKRNK